MIDYEKLKLAHELSRRLESGYYVAHHWCVDEDPYFRIHNNQIEISSNQGPYFEDFDTLDDLIAKLQKLTQPKPKYAVGQPVWHINIDDSIVMFEIGKREYESNSWLYENDETTPIQWWDESQLYPTKSQLIEAQIEYWQNMREPSAHINDAVSYLCPPFEGEIKGFKKECRHTNSEKMYSSFSGIDNLWCKDCNCQFINVPSNHDKKVVADLNVKECQHVSNGLSYITNPPQNKCLKCGELYK